MTSGQAKRKKRGAAEIEAARRDVGFAHRRLMSGEPNAPLSTSYWTDELEDVTNLLAAKPDAGDEQDTLSDLAVSNRPGPADTEAVDAALAEYLG